MNVSHTLTYPFRWLALKVFKVAYPSLYKAATRTSESTTLRNLPESAYREAAHSLWGGTSYTDLADATLNNPFGGRSAFQLGQLLSSMPITVAESRDDNADLVNDHPFLEALRYPNPYLSYQSLWLRIAYDLMFGGEFFLHFFEAPFDGPNAGRPQPGTIDLLWPHGIKKIDYVKNTSIPRLYHYRDPRKSSWSRTDKIEAVRVVHVRIPNPFNPDRGYPIACWILRALRLMASGDDWNMSVAQAKGRIPTWLVWKPGTKEGEEIEMDDDQWQDFLTRFHQAWQAHAEASMPMPVPERWEPRDANTTARDSEWLGGQQQKAREIAVGSGFDPAMMGDSANKTYNNLSTALAAAIEFTVKPIMTWVLSEWQNQIMRQRYARDGGILIVNESKLPIIESAQEREDRLGRRVDRGVMTRAEMRSQLSLEQRDDVPELDLFTVSFATVSLQSITEENLMLHLKPYLRGDGHPSGIPTPHLNGR